MRNAARRDWSARRAVPRGLLHGLRLNHFPFGLLLLALGLFAVGLTFIHSMASVDELFQRDEVSFDSHVKKVVVALPMLVLGALVRPRFLRKHAWTLYAVAIVMLLLVPLVGEERNNARRWIPTPIGFDLQPSELAKLALIVVLARVLHRNRLARLRDWVKPAALALLPMVLVAAQPDLGTAMTIVPVTLGMLYLAGGSGRLISVTVGIVVLVGLSAWKFEWVQDYQLRRIETWAASFDSGALVEGRNGPAFHVYHARVSIGNGGLEGTGLGEGVSSRAGHLPERESDSIFCVVAEELGFARTTLFLACYAALIAGLLRTAAGIRERFTRFVVAGVGLYFAAHFFVNVGVNLGLVPMTGLTLPLLSTGGSSLLTTFLALGLALGLAAQEEPSLDEDAFRA
ncbi:FtsW/RodA/SpoVE family cell cycle protein [Engelhardtia mirabilis]|uniref:Probable peptidoglycan glycosyltransferase FtsW n=1 Tax=Engelhardtia mirabilis TaxID=2528011 RepID=A0A518BPX6_9BACT|nr:Peptidoglycan glycosyltransferase MrdB [Planctomycetes bacterium Pla133]QDV03353.1 Peptidoglycan glycosyltransferase MrdB [Planctomycetes bacterium Pla86]